MDSQARVARLLDGAVDTHMHTAPGAFPRHDTDLTAARAAKSRGMDAIVIKNHHFETASRAQIATEATGLTVLGGITLNEWVGGLDPLAVDGLTTFDPAIVWLPTITAENHLANSEVEMFADEEEGPEGIPAVDDDGTPTAAMLSVLDRVAAHDLVLGLSHLAPEEAIAVVEAGNDAGIDDYLVQHPHANFLDYSLDQMATIADLGATLEFHYICTTEMMDHAATVDDYVAAVGRVGVDSAVVATDGGATANPPALAMFESFVAEMLDAGVPEADVERMVRTNPRRIFDL